MAARYKSWVGYCSFVGIAGQIIDGGMAHCFFWMFVCCQVEVDCIWNVMAHTQKPDFVFRRNGRVHWNRRGLQFSRLLAAEVCASAVVMLDIPCSEAVWRVLTTHSIRQVPLHFPSRTSPCAITFQLDSISNGLIPRTEESYRVYVIEYDLV